jgi:hypothetical protein
MKNEANIAKRIKRLLIIKLDSYSQAAVIWARVLLQFAKYNLNRLVFGQYGGKWVVEFELSH